LFAAEARLAVKDGRCTGGYGGWALVSWRARLRGGGRARVANAVDMQLEGALDVPKAAGTARERAVERALRLCLTTRRRRLS